MIRNIARRFLVQPKILIYRSYGISLKNQEKYSIDIEELENEPEIEEDNEFREQEIERKRNKSRLNTSDRNILYENKPYSEPIIDFHKTVAYQRKLYGKYGEKSGVNPGICWPTKEQLADIQEYERIAYPYTIQQVIQTAIEKRKEADQVRQDRQENILKKISKLDQWKKELNDKIYKKEAEARAIKERKDRMVEEVRRHFGFKIDPRDERFKEMLEQKEKAEKKAMKEAKRKMKEARMIAKLQETKPENAELLSKTNVESSDKS